MRKFYHYTSDFHFPAIMAHGLSRGDVPTTPLGGFNAVWLTEESKWKTQGWSMGAAVDKTAIRIEIELNTSDPNLKKWSEFAMENGVDQQWYDVLNKTGGGGANKWWIYTGVIPPEQFKDIQYKES